MLNQFDRGRNCIMVAGARPKIDEFSQAMHKGIVRAAASTDSVIISNGLKLLPNQIPKNVSAIGVAAEAQIKHTILMEKSEEMYKNENNSKASWGTITSSELAGPNCMH